MSKEEQMIFDKDAWRRIGDGFLVKDGTLGFEDGRLGFLFVEEGDPDFREDWWQTKMVAVKLDLPMDKRFFVLKGSDIRVSSLSSAWAPDQTEFVAVDTDRQVWSYKPKQYKGTEERISFDTRGHDYGASVTKVVRIGTTIYAIGGAFRIFQRIEGQQWIEHKNIPIPVAFESRDDQKIVDAVSKSRFYDLAGRSHQKIYAVGSVGTVWYFDGKRWQQLPFPTNVDLHTVACADNGDVYITDKRGSVWKGSGANWTLLCEMNQNLPFEDSAWFQERLWCANDYGMYVLEGEKLVPAHAAKIDPVPDEVAVHSHRIDVSPDGKKMLVCGGYGAALHDGTKWSVLFSGAPEED